MVRYLRHHDTSFLLGKLNRGYSFTLLALNIFQYKMHVHVADDIQMLIYGDSFCPLWSLSWLNRIQLTTNMTTVGISNSLFMKELANREFYHMFYKICIFVFITKRARVEKNVIGANLRGRKWLIEKFGSFLGVEKTLCPQYYTWGHYVGMDCKKRGKKRWVIIENFLALDSDIVLIQSNHIQKTRVTGVFSFRVIQVYTI